VKFSASSWTNLILHALYLAMMGSAATLTVVQGSWTTVGVFTLMGVAGLVSTSMRPVTVTVSRRQKSAE
jgi:hypothetical protein